MAYLAEHPDAQDTLDGIIEWWLLEQKIRRQAALVQEALTDLVAKGLVLKDQGKDSRVHYRINPRNVGKIKVFLEHESES